MSAKNKTEHRSSFLKLSPYQTEANKKREQHRRTLGKKRAKHLFNVFG